MSRSAIEEGAFLPKLVVGEPILRGIDSTPPLLAYCLSEAKPLASVGMKTAKDDPLLATWQYGLGTSLAFTSDAQPRWAAQWVGWEGFSAFWSQAARATLRRATRSNYQVRVRHDGSKGIVEIQAKDSLGYPMKSLTSDVRVLMPGGRSQPLELTQDAPGRFVGRFETSDIGSYIVSIAEPDSQGGTRVQSSGFSLSYPPEYRNYRPNRPLLERIAQTTGGQTLNEPIQALRPVVDPGVSIQELWPLFVFLAALLLPVDVAVRRIALPWSEILSKTWVWLRLRRARQNHLQPRQRWTACRPPSGVYARKRQRPQSECPWARG